MCGLQLDLLHLTPADTAPVLQRLQEPGRCGWQASACAARTVQIAVSKLGEPCLRTAPEGSAQQQQQQQQQPDEARSYSQQDLQALERRAKAKARKVPPYAVHGAFERRPASGHLFTCCHVPWPSHMAAQLSCNIAVQSGLDLT